jgi:Tol biopolymer transport system component
MKTETYRRHWLGILQVVVLLAILSAVLSGQILQFLRPEYRLTLVDRTGKRTLVGMVPVSTFAPRVSPDGREVVFDTQEDGALWIAKLSDLSTKRRLSTGGSNRGEIWSDDGRRMFYITDDGGAEALFWRPVTGGGAPELIHKPVRAAESWSSRLQRLSFITLSAGGDYDVWTYSMADKRATPFVVIPGTAQHSSFFSPDGRWIAYASAESGRLEIYVQPFPGPGPKIQVTRGGGEHPLWAPDQRELYFDKGGQLFALTIRTEPTFTVDNLVPLPISGFVQGPLRRQYDLTPDGKQFLMMFLADGR